MWNVFMALSYLYNSTILELLVSPEHNDLFYLHSNLYILFEVVSVSPIPLC